MLYLLACLLFMILVLTSVVQTKSFSSFLTASPMHTLFRHTHTHTHPFNGPYSGTTLASWYQKGKPTWILLKQETVIGSGISWAICKSAPFSRQITMPAPHHSVFYRPDASSCRPTNSVKALKAHAHIINWLVNKHLCISLLWLTVS